jgi:glycosyltransferase involved in cell wall biosynthesis
MVETARVPANRIVVNTVALLSPLTGIGHYVSQLVRRFALLDAPNDYTYFYGFFTKRLIVVDNHIHRLKAELSKASWLTKTLRETLFFLPRLRRSEFDLYFEPNFIPLPIKAKKVVTTVHDFSFKRYPDAHPKERIEYLNKNFVHCVRSNRIITVSAFTKSEAEEFLRVPPEVITPVHLGVDHDVFRPRTRESLEQCKRELGLPERFILFVGTKEPRKNLDRLLRAYLELPEWLKKEFKIVLVGPKGWGEGYSTDVFEKIRDHIVVIDYVDVDTLAYIYSLASLFVFPSLYEGFGLPPLEAMACGCPVVVSNAASLPEVCGEAGFYVDPNDVSSIADGICKVLTDSELRRGLVEKGLERARLFSWEKTAKETLEIFSQVLGAA